MALGRMEAKVISRGSGHSAVAKSAYNAREALTAERYDKREDYSRKSDDCLFSGFFAPKDAPEWAQERGRFWNAVEWREKRKDAQLGREFEIALPHELTTEQNTWLLKDFVRENFVRRGLVADVAIHRGGEGGDVRNVHAHVFVPLRRLEGDHWAEKKDRPSELDRKKELKDLRDAWEKLTNRHLARHGFTERIDMRSYAEQGVDRTPGVHLGKEATNLERRGVETELGNQNRAAANQNNRLHEVPTPEQVEEARERAAYARQQREGFRAQDAERGRTMWDEADGSTLDNARRREKDAGASRSTENDARRAMDDLARTDPIGTARSFGHHGGDRLKSPEDMRREMAQRMRGFAADPQQDLDNKKTVRDDPNPSKSHSQVKQPAPAKPAARAATPWRDQPTAKPRQEARGETEPVSGRYRRARTTGPAAAASHELAALSQLRAAVAAGRDRLQALTSRLEAGFAAVFGRSRTYTPPGAGRLHDDTSSKAVNAAVASERQAATRQDRAQEKAVRREMAREDDRQLNEKARDQKSRVRQSIWQEDMRVAELEAAAQRLRDALERPGQHDHTRERKR